MKEIIRVKLKDIDNFKNHSFLVVQDDSLSQLSAGIKENGLLNPLFTKKNNIYGIIW